MPGSVIQGNFPRGVNVPREAIQPRSAGPAWVQQRIAAPGGAAHVTPPKAAVRPPLPNATAVAVPPHFAVATGGQPLAPAVRQKMEAAFGQRFDDVRVHVSAQVQSIGALAYTHGSHIHFAPGNYDPASHRGQQILARELAHVVQQRSGRVRNPFGGGVAVVRDALLEAEADRLVQRVAAMPQNTVPRFVQRRVTAGRIVQRSSSTVEEKYYVNDKGAGIEAMHYEALHDLIRMYDVSIVQDFSRGSSSGKDELGAIAIGLTSLLDYVGNHKELKMNLKFVVHPATGNDSRSKKYGGRTFMQILDMCRAGEECHNDMAEALRECLGTLKPDM